MTKLTYEERKELPKGSLSIRRRGATRLRMLRTREMRSPGPRKAGTRSGRCGGQRKYPEIDLEK